MSEYHFPIPGSKEEASIILFVRRHWASFLGQFLLSFLMLVLPLIILMAIYFSEVDIWQGMAKNLIVLGLSIYYLITITFVFMSWITFYYDIYIICQDTIIDITQQGFFGRKISQLSLLRVQDVTSDIKGFLPTVFGYGDILVETAGEQSQNFIIKNIPNPQEVSAKIMQLHNEIIEKEERHKEILEGEGTLSSDKVSQTSQEEVKEKPFSEEEPEEESKKPTYQELLAKEQDQSKPQDLKEFNQINEGQKTSQEGEISRQDLEKGGQIDLK